MGRFMIRSAYLVAVLLLGAALPVLAQSGLSELKCDGTVNPRWVQTLRPQLSWAINPKVIQRAYQVLVATSEEKLKNDEADLWDSGKVRSDAKTVEYKGKPLSSFQVCYWKVKIWSTLYTATDWSEPALWQMGMLSWRTGVGINGT
jgi:alpha-L-rhamnosidase